ncbi:hypothetical protein [Microbacterium sp. W4I4]|uniref:hypothetical protein n=1 Tax=Microbacterium sp. W4I4 TaxID=3042295 RepID=UPI0027D827BD|nr:hypothetical protein [Microbacterium sp. W4I4]
MEWEHLFEDLEGQLAAEWESERAALDAESERLRISKLTLHERLRTMAADTPRLLLELVGGERWDTTLRAIGRRLGRRSGGRGRADAGGAPDGGGGDRRRPRHPSRRARIGCRPGGAA